MVDVGLSHFLILSDAPAVQKFLNIAETIVDFAPHFYRYEDFGSCPVPKGRMADAKLLHYLRFGKEFLGVFFGSYWDYLFNYSFNEMITQRNKVGIFYSDVEIVNTAFNKSRNV